MNLKKLLAPVILTLSFALPASAADQPVAPAGSSTPAFAPISASASVTLAAPSATAPATTAPAASSARSTAARNPAAANATIHWTPAAPDKITNVSLTDSAAPLAAITPDKHVELFNGKDFTGWEFNMRVGTGPQAPALADWTVADGLIKCLGKPNGYIRTVQAYKDYKVTVEWRFPPGKAGNTGVMVHMTAPEMMNPWPKCVECQGMNKNQGDFWFWNGATCAELKSLPPEKIIGNGKNGIARPGPDQEKAVGEWNTYAVVCAGDTVTIFVNDQQGNKITGVNLASGWIGLQSEGAGLEIRKVSIDPLPTAGAKGN